MACMKGGRCWCWNKDTGEDFTVEGIDVYECIDSLEYHLRHDSGEDWVCHYRCPPS